MSERAVSPGMGGGARFLRAFLDRFRRSAGVPASVRDDTGAELVALFAALDDLDREAAEARQAATARIAARADDVADEIEQILSDGRGQAESERAEAVKAGRRAVEAEAAEIVRAADAEAERMLEEGRRRLPELVAEVLACVMTAPP